MGPQAIIVCDTNVLVSAFGWRGPEHRLYRRIRENRLKLAMSSDMLSELKRVLAYPKLGFSDDDIKQFTADVSGRAVWTWPTVRVDAIEMDPDDNRVLECAVAAKARWIASGDKHLLSLGRYQSIPILKAQGVLEKLDMKREGVQTEPPAQTKGEAEDA